MNAGGGVWKSIRELEENLEEGRENTEERKRERRTSKNAIIESCQKTEKLNFASIVLIILIYVDKIFLITKKIKPIIIHTYIEELFIFS